MERLAAAFGPLDQIVSDLGRRSTRYVVAGLDADVLSELAAAAGGGSAIKLVVSGASTFMSHPWADWLAATQPSPAQTRRLGQVCEAASRAGSRTLLLQSLGLPPWVEVLLWEASSVRPNSWSSMDGTSIDHVHWEEMLTLDGASRTAVLLAALSIPLQGKTASYRFGPGRLLGVIPGLPAAVARHPDLVRSQLTQGDSKAQVMRLDFLKTQGCDPTPFASTLAAFLVGDAKRLREAAETWVGTSLAGILPLLHAYALTGSTTERSLAISFIARRSEDPAPFLAERLAAETVPSVRKTISDLQAQAVVGAQGQAQALPPIEDPGIRPLGPAGQAAIAQMAEAWSKHLMSWWEMEERRIRVHQASNPRFQMPIPPQPTPFTTDDVERLTTLLTAPGITAEDIQSWNRAQGTHQIWNVLRPVIQTLMADPGASPELVVRLAVLFTPRGHQDDSRGICLWVQNILPCYRKATRTTTGTRRILAAAERVGIPAADIAWEVMGSYFGLRWPLDDLWEWYAEHPEVIAGALGQGEAPALDHDIFENRRAANALALVERFPEIPASLQPLLWDLAFGGNGARRGPAQRAVGRIPGMLQRVIAGLEDSKQDVRLRAADWLATLKDPASIPALEAVVQGERSEPAKAAMMTALERLGVPIDRFLDRPGLAKAAAKGLAKGVPTDLAWLPLPGLPLPAWSDGSGLLEREVLTWWLVQSWKLKDPAPTPLLRRYAAALEPAAAHRLGEHLLQAWIAEDTRLPTPEQVADHVRAQSAAIMSNAQMMASIQAQQTTALGGVPVLTAQEWYDRMVDQYRQTPVSTQIGAKGILAVAAAMGGAGLAPQAAQYLKRWYGMRAGQCKALVQMLAATDHPTAIQVLLATATRFRTAGIRKEAEVCVQTIAAERGWSVDELADRTIPAAGFDEEGRLTLSFGARSFTVLLQDDLDLAVQDVAGAQLATLPAPRAGDDAEAAATAKKAFSEAKKQVKTIVKQQADRLYEAMCTGRRWKATDWRAFLLAHPIVGRLCRRVVWAWWAAPDAKPETFRALEDGTLTDAEDAAVVLPDGAWVAVAHPILIGIEAAARWRSHCADYEVEPLFPQVERPPLTLPAELAEEQVIADRTGYLVAAFSLRARATKLGWTRGQPEDGGWFHVYRKHFPAAHLTAVLEFTGNSLPEENRTTALIGLSCERTVPGGEAAACPLAEVPAALLSECWNDVHEIAALGTGFDPAWEKTTST